MERIRVPPLSALATPNSTDKRRAAGSTSGPRSSPFTFASSPPSNITLPAPTVFHGPEVFLTCYTELALATAGCSGCRTSSTIAVSAPGGAQAGPLRDTMIKLKDESQELTYRI
ncbi:hypothetical protein GALMADRAFT_232244 [Galerina marginata CBS 339.88]|uniref:Uncharacterized protein n=1 Tax=Galerina marginata (strain CBS 339.88) TaxID=685588 RepID=A0A067S817_GALM3|nr:hypothetical protein GALMADRAFT_232244 [Galerina marginata CBS 339.88]